MDGKSTELAIEEFLDGLALLMADEVEWAKFLMMLAARSKALNAKAK